MKVFDHHLKMLKILDKQGKIFQGIFISVWLADVQCNMCKISGK